MAAKATLSPPQNPEERATTDVLPEKLQPQVPRNGTQRDNDKTILGAERHTGLSLTRFFTDGQHHPFDEITWENRAAIISNEKGEAVFRQDDVEVPANWSQTATNVVVSKYFNGKLGTPKRENSVRQLIERVAATMRTWGEAGGYFAAPEDAGIFYAELVHLF